MSYNVGGVGSRITNTGSGIQDALRQPAAAPASNNDSDRFGGSPAPRGNAGGGNFWASFFAAFRAGSSTATTTTGSGDTNEPLAATTGSRYRAQTTPTGCFDAAFAMAGGSWVGGAQAHTILDRNGNPDAASGAAGAEYLRNAVREGRATVVEVNGNGDNLNANGGHALSVFGVYPNGDLAAYDPGYPSRMVQRLTATPDGRIVSTDGRYSVANIRAESGRFASLTGSLPTTYNAAEYA